MQVGNLVRHKETAAHGVGLVIKDLGVHCMVQWTYDAQDTRLDPGPTLEAGDELEVISGSR